MITAMTTPSDASTRQRLLDAAAELFAVNGFAATSVREICARAEANVAAINYHFGGKDQLLAEVLRIPLRSMEESIPRFADPALPLTEALTRMYLGLLTPLREGSPEAAVMRLVARAIESRDRDVPRPDHAPIRRHHAALDALVRRHLPPAATDMAVNAVCGALVGMAMHAVMGRFREGPGPQMWTGSDEAAIATLAARLARYGTAIIHAEATP